MGKVFLITGVSIFGLLGTIHLIYTFFTQKFAPFDPSVKDAMCGTSPILTKETTIWDAWIGFNASHSLGIILLAAIYIPLGLYHYDIIQGSFWFSALPLLMGIIYTILAKKYWFKIPLFGVMASSCCFIAFIMVSYA